MATMKIKKGDTVKVIAGKDKGKEGKVLEVLGNKVIVENINMISKHTKPNQSSPKGGILRQEAPIDSSNVMYVHKGTVTRIGFKTVEGKKGPKKVRIAKSTGEVID
ncbi:MAG TPA: 50S ribosomal protein L24 [Clostridiales bacterium]|jgi:large subunit ribosomal protein L24|nr:50S ribosomal protein L24 [Clostridiales bacterium]